MDVSLSPFAGVGAQFFDNNGTILSGGKIYTYAAGSTTPLASYTSALGTIPHANPIVLDSAGRVPGGEIWIADGASYKFVLETATGVLIGTYDNINKVPAGYASAVNYLGNGVTTVFGAGSTLETKLATDIYINGVYQNKNTYNISGSNIVFTQAPLLNSYIEILTRQALTLAATSANLVSYTAPVTDAVTLTVQDKLWSDGVSIEDFGGGAMGSIPGETAAANATRNNAAFADFISAVNSGSLADRRLNFGQGTYNYTGPWNITTSNIRLIGAGGTNSATILQNTSPTTDGIVFGLPENVATGNTTSSVGIVGVRISRPTADATNGRALVFQFCANFTAQDIRISQHHQGIQVVGSQDWDITNIQVYGMFSGTTERTNSFLFGVKAGVKADTTLQAAWQGRLSNFNLAGSFNTKYGLFIQAGDGLTITEGYINLTTTANIYIDPPSGAYVSPLMVSNVYSDGGFPSQNVPTGLLIANYAGTVGLSTFSNCFLGNGRDEGIKVLGPAILKLDSCSTNGLSTPPAKAMVVNNSNAVIRIDGGEFSNHLETFNIVNAAEFSIIGAQVNATGAGGYGIRLGTVVSRFLAMGNAFRISGGAADLIDTATGERQWSGNNSTISNSVFNGVRLLNKNANSADVLDFYVKYPEGTITPEVTFGGTPLSSGSYTTRLLSAVRIGQWMFGNVRIVLSSRDGLTGEFRITGLPLSAKSSTTYPCAVRLNNVAAALDTADCVGDVLADELRVVWRSGGTQVALLASDLTDTANILMTFAYEIQ